MAEVLKIAGRVYAGLILLLSVVLGALIVSLDQEVYGMVMVDLFVHSLLATIPLLATAVILETMRAMNRPKELRLRKSQEELLDMSSRIVEVAIGAKNRRAGASEHPGLVELTPEEWDEVWNACRSGRPA